MDFQRHVQMDLHLFARSGVKCLALTYTYTYSVCICMYVYIYIHIHIHTYTFIYTHVCIGYICVGYTYVCMYIYIYMYTRTHVYVVCCIDFSEAEDEVEEVPAQILTHTRAAVYIRIIIIRISIGQ